MELIPQKLLREYNDKGMVSIKVKQNQLQLKYKVKIFCRFIYAMVQKFGVTVISMFFFCPSDESLVYLPQLATLATWTQISGRNQWMGKITGL